MVVPMAASGQMNHIRLVAGCLERGNHLRTAERFYTRGSSFNSGSLFSNVIEAKSCAASWKLNVRIKGAQMVDTLLLYNLPGQYWSHHWRIQWCRLFEKRGTHQTERRRGYCF